MTWEFQHLPQPIRADLKWTIEKRLAALFTNVRIRGLLDGKVLTPTPEDFPGLFSKQPESWRNVLEVVCGRLGARADDWKIYFEEELYDEEKGEYRNPPRSPRPLVIYSKIVSHPGFLVCSIADAVISQILQEEGLKPRVAEDSMNSESDEPEDQAQAEDSELVSCIAGFGIFSSAASIISESDYYNLTSSPVHYKKFSPLPPSAYGYALALLYCDKHATIPPWNIYLRDGTHDTFCASLRYLSKTRDTTFLPGSSPLPAAQFDWHSAENLLKNSSPSACFDILLEINESWSDQTIAPAALVAAIAEKVDDHDAWLGSLAAKTLARFGRAASPFLNHFMDIFPTAPPLLRDGLAGCLASIGEQPRNCSDLFMKAIRQNNDGREHCIRALAAFPAEVRRLYPVLLDVLYKALAACNEAECHALVDLLQKTDAGKLELFRKNLDSEPELSNALDDIIGGEM